MKAAGDAKFGEVVMQVDGAFGWEMGAAVPDAGVLLHREGVSVDRLALGSPRHGEMKVIWY